MHPKNIYKNPPNFKELAVQFPDFRKYVKQELSGRTTIDYNDHRAVKELTRALLKKDFNLDVNINCTRLIPRVPLCLNYILWVEDLLSALVPETRVQGIDIGTGGVCIYSLLAAKKGWHMLATEIDPQNYKSAEDNVLKNNLDHKISVKLVPNSNTLLLDVIDKNSKYDFCMCNPPFFDESEKPLNRTSKRVQITSVASDVPTEISTSGGEMCFIHKLIQESQHLKEKIKIYTTLVGKKCDFLHLKKEVEKISPKASAFTEFCQGKTMRWGLAWSFLNIQLTNMEYVRVGKLKKRKAKPPLHFLLPSHKLTTSDEVYETTKNLLKDMEISYKEEFKNEFFTLTFRAIKNTWSNQRRKKRSEARKIKQHQTNEKVENDIQNTQTDCTEDCSGAKMLRMSIEKKVTDEKFDDCDIVEGLLIIKTENSSIITEISWLSGNKEYFYQIFQYIKNFWNKNG